MRTDSRFKKFVSLCLATAILGSNVAFADSLINKDETVYGDLDLNGGQKEVISSVWLSSEKELNKVVDSSDLKEIRNIKGDEKPEIKFEEIIWNSKNKDLYYQGKSDKSLPVEFKIRYFLDEKEVKPEDIAGKSGKLKIVIDLENRDYRELKLSNGKNRKVYTPYIVAAIVDLPTKNFKNVKSDNGKIISDASSERVSFFTIPGLESSFGLDGKLGDKEIKKDDHIEITADVEEFEMKPIMIAMTPEIPELDGLEGADTIDELKDGISKIEAATEKLPEVTQALYDGQVKLDSGLQEFVNGIDKLGLGADALTAGSEKLFAGIKDAEAGSKAIVDGAGKLKDASGKIGDGTSKLSDATTILNEKTGDLSEGAGKLAEGSGKLYDGQKQLTEGIGQMSSGVLTMKKGTTAQIVILSKIYKVLNKLEDAVMASIILNQEEKNEIISKIEAEASSNTEKEVENILNGGQASKALKEEVVEEAPEAGEETMAENLEKNLEKAEVEAEAAAEKIAEEKIDDVDAGQLAADLNESLNEKEAVEEKASLQEIDKDMATRKIGLIDKLHQKRKERAYRISKPIVEARLGIETSLEIANGMNEGIDTLLAGLSAAEEGSKDLMAGALELKTGTDQLSEGSKALNKGTGQLAEKTMELNKGVMEFQKGILGLSDGTTGLSNGLGQLAGGAGELNLGLGELNSGVGQLQTGGIALLDGSSQLVDGTGQLNDGMHKFAAEAMNKIREKLDTGDLDIVEVLEVKDEMVKISKENKTFSGITEDMDGSVKYILKTPSVSYEKEDLDVKVEEKAEDAGFIGWLKGIFKK